MIILAAVILSAITYGLAFLVFSCECNKLKTIMLLALIPAAIVAILIGFVGTFIARTIEDGNNSEIRKGQYDRIYELAEEDPDIHWLIKEKMADGEISQEEARHIHGAYNQNKQNKTNIEFQKSKQKINDIQELEIK